MCSFQSVYSKNIRGICRQMCFSSAFYKQTYFPTSIKCTLRHFNEILNKYLKRIFRYTTLNLIEFLLLNPLSMIKRQQSHQSYMFFPLLKIRYIGWSPTVVCIELYSKHFQQSSKLTKDSNPLMTKLSHNTMFVHLLTSLLHSYRWVTERKFFWHEKNWSIYSKGQPQLDRWSFQPSRPYSFNCYSILLQIVVGLWLKVETPLAIL